MEPGAHHMSLLGLLMAVKPWWSSISVRTCLLLLYDCSYWYSLRWSGQLWVRENAGALHFCPALLNYILKVKHWLWSVPVCSGGWRSVLWPRVHRFPGVAPWPDGGLSFSVLVGSQASVDRLAKKNHQPVKEKQQGPSITIHPFSRQRVRVARLSAVTAWVRSLLCHSLRVWPWTACCASVYTAVEWGWE